MMIKQDEIQVSEEFGNQRMPHAMRVTHTPTGMFVMGNCGSEEGKSRLRQDLIARLNEIVPNGVSAHQTQPDADKADLQAQLAELRRQLEALSAKAPTVTKKPRGRPKGYKVGKKVEQPAPQGYSVLDPATVQAPAVSYAPQQQYKPGKTVAVSYKPGIEA